MQTVKTHEKSEAAESTRAGRTYIPRADISETDDALWLRADMPGVDENSVEVGLHNGELTLVGHVAAHDYEALTPVYTEYNVGNYERSFRLSDAIDPEGIEAKMRAGVLELRLPKAGARQARRIEVSVG